MADNETESALFAEQKRISVSLDGNCYNELYQMARRHNVSPAYLGRLAIVFLLISELEGKFTMNPESLPYLQFPTVETAFSG